MHKQIKRLEEIGNSLSKYEDALALLGLGSVGLSRDRLDEYSDLDFFVFCKEGTKAKFINNLDWLENVYPIAYHFQNTKDGYKLLYKDGIFCEFAIFEPQEMRNIPFSNGKIIWQKDEFDENLAKSKVELPKKEYNLEYIIGEALTNLYIGLGRFHRGEKLSAYKFVQEYAFSQVLKLLSLEETPSLGEEDQFALSRRFEQRYPNSVSHIEKMLVGYNNTINAARSILDYLDKHYQINQNMKERILELINK